MATQTLDSCQSRKADSVCTRPLNAQQRPLRVSHHLILLIRRNRASNPAGDSFNDREGTYGAVRAVRVVGITIVLRSKASVSGSIPFPPQLHT